MNENMLVPVPHGEAYERLSSKKDEVLNQQMEVREKRIEIARRLESMKNSFVERERKMQQLEKDMFGLKKKDLVEEILKAKVSEARMQSKLADINVTLQVNMTKHNEIAAHKQAIALNPPVEVEAVQPEEEIETETERQAQERILREMLDNLREGHDDVQSRILQERCALTKERFEIESNLNRLRDELRQIHTEFAMLSSVQQQDLDGMGPGAVEDEEMVWVDEDEPFEVVVERAEAVQRDIEVTLADFHSRIAAVEQETHWLIELPNNELWAAMKERIRASLDSVTGFVSTEEVTNQFMDYEYEKAELLFDEELTELFLKISYHLARDILAEAADSIITDVCQELVSVVKECGAKLDLDIINVILDLGSSHSRSVLDPDDLRGKRILFAGCITDMKNEMTERNASFNDTTSDNPSLVDCPVERHLLNRPFQYSTHFTQPIANGQYVKGKNIDDFSDICSAQRIERVADVILGPNDETARHTLRAVELAHWNKTFLQPCLGGALNVAKGVSGRITFMRIFPRPLMQLSMLLVGTQFGQLLIWNISWVANEKEPILIAVTPKPPIHEQCEIVNIKECGVGGTQFLTIDSVGTVRVWSLNPLPVDSKTTGLAALLDWNQAAKKHTKSMFPGEYKEYAPLVPTCTFYLAAAELNLPLEPGKLAQQKARLAKMSTLDRVRATVEPQPEVVPASATFHPSLTMTNRHSSIMVGTVGGDCFKINMDYDEDSLDAPLVFLKPFVDLEYVHPANGAPNTVLSGIKSKRRGNRVKRELFHYHKARVILVEVIDKLSDRILTMDADGYVAIWKYSKEFFHGKQWFEPLATVKLDLDYETLRPHDETHGHQDDHEYLVSNPLFDYNVPLQHKDFDMICQPHELEAYISGDRNYKRPDGRTDEALAKQLFVEEHSEFLSKTDLEIPTALFTRQHRGPGPEIMARLRPLHQKVIHPGVIATSFYPVEVIPKTQLDTGGDKNRQTTKADSLRHLMVFEKITIDIAYEVPNDDYSEDQNSKSELTENYPRPDLTNMAGSGAVPSDMVGTVAEAGETVQLVDSIPAVANTQPETKEAEESTTADQKVVSVPVSSADDASAKQPESKDNEETRKIDDKHEHSPTKTLEYKISFWRTGAVGYVAAKANLVDYTMAFDGSEVVFLISTIDITKNRASSPDNTNIAYHVVSLESEEAKFRGPLITFAIPASELFISMQVGPILKETLTRFVFILTNKRCRCFSLGTGQEILMDPKVNYDKMSGKKPARKREGFPLLGQDIKRSFSSFTYHMSALCPMQRMLVFGGPQDARLAVYIFRHELDHSEISSESQKLFKKLLIENVEENAGVVSRDKKQKFRTSAFNEPVDILRKRSIAMILPDTEATKQSLLQGEAKKFEAILRDHTYVYVTGLLEELMAEAWMAVDEVIAREEKRFRIEEMYGPAHPPARPGDSTIGPDAPPPPYGVVAPTEWPPLREAMQTKNLLSEDI